MAHFASFSALHMCFILYHAARAMPGKRIIVLHCPRVGLT